MLKLFFRP